MELFLTVITNEVKYSITSSFITFILEYQDIFFIYIVITYMSCNFEFYGRDNTNRNMNFIFIILRKKIGYLVVLLISFGISHIIRVIGVLINFDLSVSLILGWYVFLSLVVQEINLILSSLKRDGIKIPKILTKTIDKINKVIEQKGDQDE